MNNKNVLFSVTATNRIAQDDTCDQVVRDLLTLLQGMNKMMLTCYRAGQSVAELVIERENNSPFCLTIWQGELNVPPVSEDDIRLAHKEISLPDVTDILLLVVAIARDANLSPSIGSNYASTVLVFNS